MRIANTNDRTPSALAMKLINIAGLDSEITVTCRSGPENTPTNDRAMWDESARQLEPFRCRV